MFEDIKTIQNLIDTLLQMKEHIQKIYDIEDQKYDVIKNMEMDILVNLNEEESMFVQKVDNIETQRVQIVAQLATTMGCDSNATISQLAPLFPQEQRDIVLQICGEIKVLCTRLEVITERNEYILKSNTEILTQILDLTQGSPQDQYNSQGMTAEVKKQSLHMLDQLI